MRTVVAIYDRFEDAQSAVRALHDSGFSREEINLIANDASGEYSRSLGTTTTTKEVEDVGSGAGAGAGIGAVLGGLGGLLVGLGALAIPGIGPVLAAGPIAAALAGAGIGAVAGGLIGALVDLGVPEEHAQYYAEGIRRGGTLVTVRADDAMAEEARMLLNNFNPIDIQTRAQTWRDEGWNATGMTDTSMQDRRSTDEVRSSDYSYNRSAAVPVTGSDMEDDDDDESMTDQSLLRDASDYGVTGMPLDRDRDRGFDTGETSDRTFRRDDETRDQLGDPSYGAGSTYDRDVNRMGGSNIPVTGSEQSFSEDPDDGEDIGQMSDHMRDDIFGRDRAGTGATDIPVTGGTMDMADIETNTANWDLYDRSFQADYRTRYGMTANGYDYYQPAYRYGYDLANDPRYTDSDWDHFEMDARRDWETRGYQSTWDDVKDAVRHAWRSVTGR